MKQIFIFGIVMVFVCLIAWSLRGNKTIAQVPQTQKTDVEKTANMNQKTPVLVELFTSEGCSSCPPADRVLAQLEREQTNTSVEIITLALHVDYWNYLGWRDEFSAAAYSQRQSGYAEAFKIDSIYTPQMVVDGQTQFVGSNLGTAQKAITDAAKTSKTPIELSTTENKLKVKISDLSAGENSYVWLAIAEDDLKTSVKRGENSGKTLNHVSVVREMKLLGNLASADKSFETEVKFKLLPDWKKGNVKFVAFVQGEKTKRIFAVNKYKLNG